MPEVKTDCFGYKSRLKECSILTELVCKCRECTFYKTKEKYQQDLQKYPPKS